MGLKMGLERKSFEIDLSLLVAIMQDTFFASLKVNSLARKNLVQVKRKGGRDNQKWLVGITIMLELLYGITIYLLMKFRCFDL